MLCLLVWGAGLDTCAGQTEPLTTVLTYHNDNDRTGANAHEAALTLANVNSTAFGQLFSHAVDGPIFGQPLVMANVAIPGQGMHNVVYVVTAHDSVYAFDADNPAGANAAPLWHTTFLGANVTSVPSGDVGCTDISGEIGIFGTPVIDPVSGTLYVVAKTEETTDNEVSFVQRLHALNLASGAEQSNSPVVIEASVAGTGDNTDGAGQVPFDAGMQLNRAGLLLSGGVVYLPFCSQCDNRPFHGWLLGYDALTLAQVSVFNPTPNGWGGGFWQAGGGPACDTNGNIYLPTGNGTFDQDDDFGDSVLKFIPNRGLLVADYFTPFDQDYMANEDIDLGSGGMVLLPEAAGSAAHPHLLAGAGKDGRLYLLDRDNLGQFNATDNSQIVEELDYPILGGSFSTPAYFNQTLYYVGADDVLTAFPIADAYIDPSSAMYGDNEFNYPGATPSISANGAEDAILWLVDTAAYASGGPAVLHAYNAGDVTQELYNSTQAGLRDTLPGAVKFTVPTIANGKVYVGGQMALAVLGLWPTAAPFIITPAGFTNGAFQVELTGPPQLNYVLQASTDLTNWVSLVTNTPAVSPFYLTDPNPATAASQFYRALITP